MGSAFNLPLQATHLREPGTMADRMWGGVPFTVPSSTAIKYLSGAVKVPRECNIPAGGRYNARQTMDREIVGHRLVRQDMLESIEYYDKQRRSARSEPKQEACTGLGATRLSEASSYLARCNKPGAGLGGLNRG